LDDTAVGDEGVKALAALPVLSSLCLNRTGRVSDVGVRALVKTLVAIPTLDTLLLHPEEEEDHWMGGWIDGS
jgi:hypothetical protein